MVKTVALALALLISASAQASTNHRTSAEFKSIAGVYRGSLVSASSGQPMGSMEIELAPSISASDDLDHPAFQGNLVIANQSDSHSFSISQASYDSSSGQFTAQITEPAVMTVSGVLNGSDFTGSIAADGFPSYAGKFTLGRDASLPAAPPALASTAVKTYSGVADGHTIQMVLRPDPSEVESIGLVSTQTVEVQINVDPAAPIRFQTGRIEAGSGRLVAQQLLDNEDVMSLLNCQATASQSGYECAFTTSAGTEMKFSVQQK